VNPPPDAGLPALYFDGRSARGQAVQLTVQDGCLVASPPATLDTGPADMRWPIIDVQWPETTRHGQRVLHLRSGGSLQALEAPAFDAWRSALLRSGAPLGAGARDSWVVRAQQSWRTAVGAALLLVILVGAGWRWGVPWAASGVLAVLPASVDRAVGDAALKSLEDRWLKPSALPAARQSELRDAFAHAVAAAYPQHTAQHTAQDTAQDTAQNAAPGAPAWQLRFAAADKAIGPNAFALPGGTMILTDAMVDLLQGQDDAVMGVLAHELGHVRHRHGMRAFVQVGLVSAVASLILGDFSSVLAAAPALVAQMAYSRDAEREADAESVRVMRASGRPPGAMVLLFERLKSAVPERVVLPIALSSHPADEERLQFFRDADRGR
jgi:Zn-dependent protease with chaperone function